MARLHRSIVGAFWPMALSLAAVEILAGVEDNAVGRTMQGMPWQMSNVSSNKRDLDFESCSSRYIPVLSRF